ncbi:MAG: hypothetical protein R2751_19260 [Bacteroidales bacterium]
MQFVDEGINEFQAPKMADFIVQFVDPVDAQHGHQDLGGTGPSETIQPGSFDEFVGLD